MDLDLHGCLINCADYPIDFILHRGRAMVDDEARTVINYGLAHGLKYISEVPDEVADAVCEPGNTKYAEYEPKESPRYVSERRIREVLESFSGEELIDDVIEQIIESL